MNAWLATHQGLLGWLTLVSVVTFVVSLATLPWLVARIPADYFAHRKRQAMPLKQRHPLIRLLLLMGKNLLGTILLTGGVVMLFLPGQGLLTIMMGLLLLDYPGKYTLERRIVRQHSVYSGLNWLRARAGAPPLILDDHDDAR